MSVIEPEQSVAEDQSLLRVQERRLWVMGAVLMASSIALGAFGAHAVKSRVSEQALSWWETAAAYHRAHGLSMLALATLWPRLSPRGQATLWRSAYGFLIGTLLFSGSLYLMTLTSLRALGMITPLGGTLWLVAWVGVAVAVSRENCD